MDVKDNVYKNKCCVPECNDRTSKRHRFPKNTSLLQQWVKVIKNAALEPLTNIHIYQSYYVCHRHFAEECLVPGTRRGLTRNAIPALHLPVLSEKVEEMHFNITQHANETLVIPSHTDEHCEHYLQHSFSGQSTLQIAPTSEVTEGFGPPKSPVVAIKQRRGILQSVHVTRQRDLSPRCKKFYKMVGNWAHKTARLQHKVSNLQTRLRNAEKVVQSPTFSNLMDHVNKATYTFIMQQVRTQSLKPKARRFTMSEKILALTLLKGSRKGYHLLSKMFCLPSVRTLTNLLNKVPYKAGINDQIFNSLKLAVAKLKDRDRVCAVIFDETSLAPMFKYNEKLDRVEGVEDFGDKQTARIADHANVFMVKGIHRQWKQPVSFSFHSGPAKAIQLKKMVKDVIAKCQEIGLEVVATICDQGSANQAAVNSLIEETKQKERQSGSNSQYFGFGVNGKDIVPLYDVPHLFKGIRNNLLIKDLKFEQDGKIKLATWEHIKLFYFLDSDDDTRITPKLTDLHVLSNKINKMKVSYMSQVFSHTVGSLMKRISKWDVNSEHKLSKEAEDTADFILFMDKLFDSLNGNAKVAAQSKPLKGGVTRISGHEAFWREAINMLDKMNFFHPKTKRYGKVPSIINLISTIKGFIYLAQTTRKYCSYFLPRALNQDCLENFFGAMRSYGRRQTNPDVAYFVTSFKALLVNNFISSHSPSANCEADFCTGALDNLRCFVTGEDIAGVHPLAVLEEDIPGRFLSNKKSGVAKSTIAYVAGFIVKKALDKVKGCLTCKQNLLHSDGDVPLDAIEARQYRASTLQKPGSCMYFVTTQSLSRLFYLIPRYCHHSNLKNLLQNTLHHHMNFNVFNCRDHEIGKFICYIIVKCILHFWCRQIRRILSGKDEKFVIYLRKCKDHSLVDPVKLEARKKYLSKLRYKKKREHCIQ